MIINQLANILNDFIINLYAQDIKFWQIIIGLIIFDFIIWIITNMIKESITRRYFFK